MTRLRQGFLSDENMRKECMLHQPIPMNRLDLLPRPMENRSGLYYRPLKETKIIARPQSAGVMLEATERLTGNNLKADYMIALKEAPKIVKVPTYPNTLPDTQGIPVAPNVGNAYSIATISYAALANQVGIPTSLSSGMSASVPPPPVSVVDSATTLSEGDSAVTLSEGDSAVTLSEGDSASIPESLSSEPELTEMPMGTQVGESGRTVVPTTEPPKITRGRIHSGRIIREPDPVKRRSLPPLMEIVSQPPLTPMELFRTQRRETEELMRREILPPLMEMGEEQQIEIQQKPRRPITRQEPRPVMRQIV